MTKETRERKDGLGQLNRKAAQTAVYWSGRVKEWLDKSNEGTDVPDKMDELMQEFYDKRSYFFELRDNDTSQEEFNQFRLWLEGLRIKIEKVQNESGDYLHSLRNIVSDIWSELTGLSSPFSFEKFSKAGKGDVIQTMIATGKGEVSWVMPGQFPNKEQVTFNEDNGEIAIDGNNSQVEGEIPSNFNPSTGELE